LILPVFTTAFAPPEHLLIAIACGVVSDAVARISLERLTGLAVPGQRAARAAVCGHRQRAGEGIEALANATP
jgi:hypothetical protein